MKKMQIDEELLKVVIKLIAESRHNYSWMEINQVIERLQMLEEVPTDENKE